MNGYDIILDTYVQDIARSSLWADGRSILTEENDLYQGKDRTTELRLVRCLGGAFREKTCELVREQNQLDNCAPGPEDKD